MLQKDEKYNSHSFLRRWLEGRKGKSEVLRSKLIATKGFHTPRISGDSLLLSKDIRNFATASKIKDSILPSQNINNTPIRFQYPHITSSKQAKQWMQNLYVKDRNKIEIKLNFKAIIDLKHH